MEENYNSYKGLFHKTSPTAKSELGEGEKRRRDYTYAAEDPGGGPPAQDEVSPEAVDIDEYDASGKNPFFDGD